MPSQTEIVSMVEFGDSTDVLTNLQNLVLFAAGLPSGAVAVYDVVVDFDGVARLYYV